ncbi:MAG: L-histidine N(alpha)-methyltransferase [Bacteroidota bacterium]
MARSSMAPFPKANYQPTLSTFARDVQDGLLARPKQLSSKYFYDQRGDALFQAIMSMPEYYLTDCELEIFKNCAQELVTEISNRPLDLIELGAGDGTKTQHLIQGLLDNGISLRYLPIDISANALEGLGNRIKHQFPDLPFEPLQGDYFSALQALAKVQADRSRLFLFPGANIGNFKPEEARRFLRELRTHLRPGDYLLTGFDLKKDPSLILAAYNDPAGHTAAFNLNILTRINRELGGNFESEKWGHWETYDPLSGAARSFLVAKEAQLVRISQLDMEFEIEAWETISVEISQKYSLSEVEKMAAATGFQFVRHFQDERQWFSDTLWRV